MLWYKSFVETRRWFMLGALLLMAQVVAMYVAYPADPVNAYPNGALGVLPDEMTQLRSADFRGYVWLRWFSTTMLLFWPVYAIALAGTDLEGGGREYLLSLPLTRRRIVLTRLTVALAQIAVLTVVPSLLVSAMAPLRGQTYPVQDALVHSAILLAGGFGLIGLTIFLRTVMNDVAAFTAVGSLVVFVLCMTFLARDLTPYSILRVMNGAEYYFHDRVPWTGIVSSLAVGTALILVSMRMVGRRDF